MKKKGRALLISGAVLSSLSLGLFSYLLVMKGQKGNADMEAIDITSPDTVSVLDYDLGTINPGERKEMRIDITSRVGFPIYCTVRFLRTMESDAFSYLRVGSTFLDERADATMESCFEGYLFQKRMEGKTARLLISYTLREDVPSRILEEDLAFGIEICARNVIG